MKKISSLLTAIIGITCLASCGSEPTFEATTEEKDFAGISYTDNDYFGFGKLYYHVEVGEKTQVEIDSVPVSYGRDQIKFKSLNESVASVSETGEVTGKAKGIADIAVSTLDDKVLGKVRISVSNNPSEEETNQTIENLQAIYADPGYKTSRKFSLIESSSDYYSTGGVRQYGSVDTTKWVVDLDEGYISLDDAYKSFDTAGGIETISHVKYTFYIYSYGGYTRMLSVRPTGKAFYDLNTYAYLDETKYADPYAQIIYDLLDMWFTSGKKMVTDMISDYEGKSALEDLQKYGGFVAKAINNNSLHYTYEESGSDTTTPEDELEYMDIPAYTPYTYSYTQEEILSAGHGLGYNTCLTEKFHNDLDGKDWERTFSRTKLFSADVEYEKVTDPKKAGYAEAETIYDL